MKIVQVTYTTRAEFAGQNQNNIKNVMNDLSKQNHSGISYTACLKPDGKTFIHTAFFGSEEDQKLLSGLDSFKTFQDQLKASMPEVPPVQELLNLVSCWPLLF